MKKYFLLLALACSASLSHAGEPSAAVAETHPVVPSVADGSDAVPVIATSDPAPGFDRDHAVAHEPADETVVHAPLTPVRGAMLAAAADGATTLFGVASRALAEGNGLAPSSPLGIVMMTALKVGAGHYADDLEPQTRSASLKAISAVFGAAAVNNALLIATLHPVVAVTSGLFSAVWFWHDTDRRLDEERLAGEARLRLAAAAVADREASRR